MSKKTIKLDLVDRKAAPGAVFVPSTLNEAERSIEVVAATEAPALIYDPQRGEVVEEVLMMDGGQFPAKVPLTIEHERNAGSVIGSLRDMKVEGGKLTGRVQFSSSEDAEPFFVKVREGHLDSFSVTYDGRQSVWIDEDRKRNINGRDFSGPLLVTKKWSLRSLGLVIYPADQQAKARSENDQNPEKEIEMDKKLRAFLERSGLKKDATDEEAMAFLDTLDTKREAPEAPASKAPVVDEEAIRAEAAKVERARVTEINAMVERYEFPAEEAKKLIDSGATVEMARKAVLDHMDKTADPKTPAIPRFEVIKDEKEKFRSAAEDSIVMRASMPGVKIDKPAPGADELRGLSLVEMARHSLRIAGHRHNGDPMEMVGRAMTTSDFPYILANVANKSLMTGWETTPTTWQTWCGTGSVSNFLTHTLVNASEFSDLEEIPEASEYKYGKRTETKEEYKVVTYGKMAAISRQAVINDDLNAITSKFMGMGEAVARKINDLPYAVLVANAVMGDGIALFDASTHKNYETTGGAPSQARIAAMILAMGTQKDLQGLRSLNISAEYIIMPKALEGNAEVFFQSSAFSDHSTVATDSSFASTRVNPYAGTRFQRVYEGYFDANGLAAGWFGAARKGKTINLYFLNGVQAPYMEMQNGWNVDGTEMKVRIDAGAKAVDWRGLYWNDGA